MSVTPETFDKECFNIKVDSRTNPETNKGIPYGKLMYQHPSSNDCKPLVLKFNHLVRLSCMFKGEFDKENTRTVFVSFPETITFRDTQYDIPESAATVAFLKDVFVPAIHQAVYNVRMSLGLGSFNPKTPDSVFKHKWLREVNGEYGFYATVSTTNIPDRPYGKYVPKVVTKSGQPKPLTDFMLSTNELLARVEGIAFEVTSKSGASNIKARLYGAVASNMRKAEFNQDASLVQAAAEDAADDVEDIFNAALQESLQTPSSLQANALLPAPASADKQVTDVNPADILDI